MDTNQNWKTFFSQTDLRGIVARFNDAKFALNSSINGHYNVIHPGALMVFCGILDNITSEMHGLLEQCDRADLDLCCEEKTMPEEKESHD